MVEPLRQQLGQAVPDLDDRVAREVAPLLVEPPGRVSANAWAGYDLRRKLQFVFVSKDLLPHQRRAVTDVLCSLRL